MKNITLFISLIFVSLTATAEIRHLRLGPGKVMAYEHIVSQASAPTLVLLPGVNRALTADDASVEVLQRAGWNLVLPSLPAHPESLKGLKKDEKPYFSNNSSIRERDFAEDIETLLNHLMVKEAIPVSLSYSAAVAAHLDPALFPHIIETVPMGNPSENNPQAAAIGELWESWFRLNPYLAPYWIRQFRDQAYWAYWGAAVDATLLSDANAYGPAPRVWDIKNGYVTIARASEDFDFTKWDFEKDQRTRDFVFAGNEDPVRLKNQIVTLKNYLASGKPARVVVVEGVGHILPSDSPIVYAKVLALLSSTSVGKTQFLLLNKEGTNRAQWQDRAALEEWMEKAL